MSTNQYTIVESVGSATQSVNSFEDLEKHHPSSGQEAGRDYETIDGHLEEIRKTSDDRTLIKKDFVLLVNGSNQSVPVPCPVSGYVKTKTAYGTVSIYDSPGGNLIGQVLHLNTHFKVKDGDYVEYGQPVGIQSGTGASGTVTYAIHAHVELEKAQFIRYIADIASGAIIPGEGLTRSKNDIQPYQFPLRKADGSHFQTEELFKALEQETSGHYLLGNHGFWHGGIHFTEKSIPHCTIDQPIRCIADGEVVAYRLNRNYLQSDFKGLTEHTNLQYSTSFCIIRHTYESTKRPPEKKDKQTVNWIDHKISLSCERYGRDVADVTLGESGNFESLMPIATELQIIEIQESASSGYRFANARILNGDLSGVDKDGHSLTRTTGETIWFAAFDKNGNIAKNKNNIEIFKKLTPDPPEEKISTPAKPESNKLTFYSLYMHLLPFELFQEKEKLFKRRVKIKAKGLNVRTNANLTSTPLGVISTGSILEILSIESAHRKNPEDTTVYELAQARIISGTVRNSASQTATVGDTVWIALSITEENKPTKSFIDEIPKQTLIRPNYWRGKVSARVKTRVAAYQHSNDEDSKRIGLISANSTLEYHTDSLIRVTRNGQLNIMAKCSIISGGLWDRPLCPAFVWICIDSTVLELNADSPDEFDSVVSVSIPIKAGDPISYLGLYETPASVNGGKNSLHQAHFEIFTSDKNLNNFLRNEAEVKDGNQYLLLPKGTELHNKSILSSNPMLLPPTSRKLNREHTIELSKCPIQKDGEGQEWYPVTVCDNAQTITGLVKKPNTSTLNGIEIITSHDWEKLGFRVVEETNSDADGFLDPENMPSFFQDIYHEIDQQGDQNGTVTPIELQAALRDPALRERWSKLIAYHPTEWQAKSNEPKWTVLEDLIKENYENIKKESENSNIQLINNFLSCTRELLRHEKERIDNLVFWDELEGAMQITLPKQVYHFHPIAFMGNIRSIKTSTANRSDWAHSAFASLLGLVESNNDYSAYNRTHPAPIKSFYDTDLTTLTIAQVQKKQEDRVMFATGRFQLTPDTLSAAVKCLNIDTNLKYDPAIQDKIFNEYLIKVKRKALINYLEGDGSVEDAIYAWAMEFASAGVRKGKRISPIKQRDENGNVVKDANGKPLWIERTAGAEGGSYYLGDGLNVAHILPDEMVKVLEESKRNGN